MDTSKTFDAYEVIGVITPGTVVALLLALEWPELKELLGKDGLSLGDLGLFVMMAFVLGHLVQTLGNIIEEVLALIVEMPSSWVRKPTQKLLTDGQRDALLSKIAAMEGAPIDPLKIDKTRWRNIVMRAYSRVRAAGKSARIDAFNRTYGLFRGLSAAFIGALAWYAYAHPAAHQTLLVVAVLALAALWRMQRASINYARSLFHEFMDL